MIRAMVIKELRETWWIAAIGLALYLWLVKCLTGHPDERSNGFSSLFALGPTTEVPFTGSQFLQPFVIISCLLALALGLRQSLAESIGGNYLFLLHRPWPRRAFFLAKLGVGAGLIWLCGGATILLYALWAATPGNVPAPFEWSMTLNAWGFWLAAPLAYLGAFLCGLRPAHWLGTKLLPLPAIGIGMFLLAVPWVWWIAALGIAAAYAGMITVICNVAQTRDYS